MYSNDVRFVSGRDNSVADILSRPDGVPMAVNYTLNVDEEEALDADVDPLPGLEVASMRTLTPVTLETVSHLELEKAQKSCPEVVSHEKGQHARTINMKYVEFSPNVHLYCDMSRGKARPLVPSIMRKTVFNMYHMLNHMGTRPTITKVERSYYWPILRQDVSRWVSECMVCLACKQKRTVRPPVNHIPVLPKRFSQVQVDVVGPLVPSQGYRYLLTVICRTSRWVAAYPMKEQTSEACTEAFIQNWVPTFGLPYEAVSDNGAAFIGGLWKGIHEALGTIVTYTPPLHPQSLGSLERQHKDIKSGLRASLYQMNDRYGDKWLTALPWTLLARRTAYQPELDTSPAEIVLGQTPRVPGDLVENEGEQLTTLLDRLRTNAAQPPIQTAHHDKITPFFPESAKVATHVMQKKGKPGTLGPVYEGPFPIRQRIGDSCLKIGVGNWASGQPRHELTHWNNCYPVPLSAPLVDGQKAPRGRKQLNVNAVEFQSQMDPFPTTIIPPA